MLNIKEIALKVADSLRNKIDGISHMQSNQGLVAFAEALIESYKAELLEEVGDPIAYYDPDLDCGSAGISFDPLSDGIYLYTSNQVAAVILKVTNQMKEDVARYRGKWIAEADRTEAYLYENQELRAQLATAQEEIERLKHSLKLEQQLSDSLKMAARMLGTGNYVDWIKTIRNSHDQLAKQNEPLCTAAMLDEWFLAKSGLDPKLPLYTLPPTAEQIVNETAEAIAKMLESGSFLSTESKVALAANGAAKAIRRGAWKEFKK